MKIFLFALSGCLLVLLISCSSVNKVPEANEALVLVYVSEFHKSVIAPIASVFFDETENPVTLSLKAPIAGMMVPAVDSYKIVGFKVNNFDSINLPNPIEFPATGGSVSLLPMKVTIINKSRIEIQPLNELDISFIKGQLAKNKKYSDITVRFPDPVNTD